MSDPLRWSLTRGLSVASGLLVTALLAVAAVLSHLTAQIRSDVDEVGALVVPQLQRIAEIELNVTRASLQLRHAILARTAQDKAAALADVAERKRLVDERLSEFGKAATTPEDKAAFTPMQGLTAPFWVVGGENLALIERGEKEAVFAFLADKTVPARDALLAPLPAEKKRKGEMRRDGLGAISKQASDARLIVVIAVLLVGLGLIGFVVYGVRLIHGLGGEPDELKRVADAVAAGRLGTAVLRAGDTRSTMAALSTMTRNLSRTVQSVRENAESAATASAQIADIISVIDGIAFRANLLALNAAVEAARAGEQGRGFAVVASEVRSLAQRSAASAREIKTLVGTSVERVEQGTPRVDRAGATMQEIVASIQRVTEMVGEISASGTEQRNGVNQVGQAVSKMDQATQQNAALVEQSAAAAESLEQQSQQLVQAVAVFRLA